MQNDSYIVWDLETTGLDPNTDKIVELAALTVVEGIVTQTHSVILNNGIDIPAQASAVHGITREMCEAEGADPKLALLDLAQMLLNNPANLTHNGFKFDIPFLIANLKSTNIDPQLITALEQHLYDTGIDTAVLYKARNMVPPMMRSSEESFKQFADRVMAVRVYGLKYNVAHCCQQLGIDTASITLHRALGDITLTNLIYRKLNLL